MTASTSSPSATATAPSASDHLTGIAPLVGRVLMGAIFLLSGFAKLAAPAATIAYIGASGLPLPTIGYVAALAVEIGGGLALVVGFRTRLAAAVLAGFALLTALVFHRALGDQNQFIHFWKNLALAGGLLQVVSFGPGRISIDRR